MRFLHLSDLHLGKRLGELSLLPDQEHILKEILTIIDNEVPDAVLIAGDVYDKSTPSEEAVKLFGGFLSGLAERHLPVYIISGNHDSAVRLSFAADLIDSSGIHIAPVYDGSVKPFLLKKNGQMVNIYLLPYLKPVIVRNVLPDRAEEIHNHNEALRVALDNIDIDPSSCNILLAHQFVTGASRTESEEVSVGGMDNVDASLFDAFDYVALGHLHRPQSIGRETLRYCGTPLKYSFSEAGDTKSVTLVDIDMEKNISIRIIPLVPLHDMREIKGTYNELTAKKNYENTAVDDYLHITLTDEEDIPDGVSKLQIIYPNLLKLTYDNERTRQGHIPEASADTEKKDPLTLFSEFFESVNNRPMSTKQTTLVQRLIEEIWEEK